MNRAENFDDSFVAVIEEVSELFTDHRAMHKVADKAERQFVMYEIGHLDAGCRFAEMVLVMPETVGTATLFVDKIDSFIDLGDLCHPVHPKPGKGAQPVLDDLTGVNPAAVVRGYWIFG